MAHAIRHQQRRGEVAPMRGIPRGFAVSAAAIPALLAPTGAGHAERRDDAEGRGDEGRSQPH